MVIDIPLRDRKRMFGSHSSKVLIVRDLVVVRSSRELDMKAELRIDVLIHIQAKSITAANVLERAGNSVARTRLHVRAKSKITAEFETGKTAGNRFEPFGNILCRRCRCLRLRDWRTSRG